jgi:hypothetical protein
MKHTTGRREIGVWLVATLDQPDCRVWGLTGVERLRRTVIAAGVPQKCIRVGPLAAVNQTNDKALAIFHADYAFDERLVRALLESPGAVLLSPSVKPYNSFTERYP